jgi:hypothetical protein
MPKAYSGDLPERVIEAVETGASQLLRSSRAGGQEEGAAECSRLQLSKPPGGDSF